MLPLLKKKTDASTPAEASAWHPNFRNFKALPDTKVVRTAFVVNAIFIVVAIGGLVWTSYRLYQWRSLRSQIAEWQKQIDRDAGPSSRAIAQYKKFQSESARVDEVSAFVKSRPILSELLVHLGGTLPQYLALDRIDLNANAMNIRGTLRGAPDQASGRASTYLQQLKADAFFAQRFSDIGLVSLNRDATTGVLIVEISFKLKEAKK